MGDQLGKRTRYARMNATSRLNGAAIEVAWALYDHGFSLGDIADVYWRDWGYANAHTARCALYQAFRREGRPMRDRVTAGLLRNGSL